MSEFIPLSVPNFGAREAELAGQAITSGGVTVYMPVVATTDAGEAQTEQYAAFPSPTCSR